MTKQITKPIYDDRVKHIIEELELGKTREQIAEGLGHTTYKSLDIYMNKRNLKWNREIQNYEPKNAEYQISTELLMSGTKRIRGIINNLKKGKNSKEVALQYGFKSHAELGNFMKEQGYVWNSELKNYVVLAGKIEGEEMKNKVRIDPLDVKPPKKGKEPIISFETSKKEQATTIQEKQLEIIDILSNNKEGLKDLLGGIHSTNKIPRYAIAGIPVSKSFNINHDLVVLIKQFCDERNVTQREILEAAFIEFLKKYGYENQVKREFNC